MKLLKYVVPHNNGLAPNPFGKYCTLAVCTLNHMNANIDDGDYILGHSTKDTGWKLIYIMRVTEVINRNDYFYDKRFNYKKPEKYSRKKWKRFGDNMYFIGANGKWKQHPTSFHDSDGERDQDTKYSKVFISEDFYYLGHCGFKLSNNYDDFIWDRCGFKYMYIENKINKLIAFVKKKYKSGMISSPFEESSQPKC
jgi:hypothetical protein